MLSEPPTRELLAGRHGAIRAFVKALNDASSERLLFFYGESGTGKSRLLRFLSEYCCRKLDQEQWLGLSALTETEFLDRLLKADGTKPVLTVLIDFGMPARGYDRPLDPLYGLLMLRRALAVLPFPRFDFALVWYLYKTKRLTNERLWKLFPSKEMDTILATADIVRGGSLESLRQIVTHPFSLESWRRLKLLVPQLKPKAQFETIKLLTPESDLVEDLPRLFAEDLKSALSDSETIAGVALFFDTHDAFWGPHERDLADLLFFKRDEWLRRLLTELGNVSGDGAEPKSIVTVVAGREAPRWATAKKAPLPAAKLLEPLTDSGAQKYLHVVEALTETAAEQYLENVGIIEPSLRKVIVECARSNSQPRVNPLYMGLCVDSWRVAKANSTGLKAEDFATLTASPNKIAALIDFLLHHLDPGVAQALKLLSVPRSFDSNFYRQIQAGNPQLTEAVLVSVQQLSFVLEMEMNGSVWYRFNQLVQAHLSELATDEPQTRRARETLHRYYSSLAGQTSAAEQSEAIYQLFQLDWKSGINEWVRLFEKALQEQNHGFMRQWLSMRPLLPVNDEFWSGRICQAAGDYFTLLKKQEDATQEYEYAWSAYNAVLAETRDNPEAQLNNEHVLLRLNKLKIVNLKAWQLEAVDYPFFNKQNAGAVSLPGEKRSIEGGREHPNFLRNLTETNRLVEQICYLRGSYLVTGYRGVGKTSFVNYALHKAAEKLRVQEQASLLIPIWLSVANYKDNEAEKLLIRTIRSLYQAVLNSGRYWDLPAEIREELSVASKKTLAKVSQNTKDSLKETFGVSDALATTWSTEVSGEGGYKILTKLGAKVSRSQARTITRTRSEEQAKEFVNALEFLSYDREIAEAQLISLIHKLGEAEFEIGGAQTQTTGRLRRLFWRLAGKLMRKNYLESPAQSRKSKLHLVFVFDEMDKVELDRIKTLLPSMKEILLTSKATFIFIGGEVIASDWLGRERPEGDPSYGIFADMIYVPLFSDEEFKSLAQQMVKEEGVEFPEDLLNHLILHSYGTPREFFRQILRYVIWEGGNPALKVPLNLTRLRTYTEVYPTVRKVTSQIPSGLPNEIKDYLRRYVDEWLIMFERTGDVGFEYNDRMKAVAETTSKFGGYWSQVAQDHFSRFFKEMTEDQVIQKMEGVSPERYKFSSQYTLGQLRQLGGIANLPEAAVITVRVGAVAQTRENPVDASLKTGLEVPPVPAEIAAAAKPDLTPVPFRPGPPPPPAIFVGRVAEQRLIADALAKNVVVQIVGMPGIGKSALAKIVANNLRDRFVDGVAWVDVDENTTPGTLLDKLAATFNFEFRSPSAHESELRSFFSNKRALIVINGADRLETVPIVGNKDCPTMITSRRRFATLLPLGTVVNLDKMFDVEAIELLQQVMGQFQSDGELKAAHQVGLQLDNNPMALDIAARIARDGRLSATALSEQLQKTDNLLDLLKLPLADTAEASVPLSFNKSYERLTKEQQLVFRATSVFEKGFEAAAVAQVAGISDEERVKDILANLSELSLLTRSGKSYSLHLLLRSYALKLAEEKNELSGFRGRHSEYIIGKIAGSRS